MICTGNLQVGESFVDIVSREENFLLRIPDNDLVVRLPGSVENLQLQPRQGETQVLGEGLGGAEV